MYCHRFESRAGFGDTREWKSNAIAKNILLPLGTFAYPDFRTWQKPWYHITSAVPHIPPPLRPKFALYNYYILFEVKEWQTYPVDPFLLRRIARMLYVVEDEWELTALETSLLAGMTQGN